MKSSASRSKAGSGARPARAARSLGSRIQPLDAARAYGRGEFPSTLYLEGPSEAIKTALLAELRHAWRAGCPESPAARVFRAAETGVEEILASFQGASLFSPRDLIIVLEVEDLGRSEKRIAALAQGLKTPAGASCLVFVESPSETHRKSLDSLRATCATLVEALPIGRAELLKWGAVRVAREAVPFDPTIIELVADACEGDTIAFFGELEKLCTISAGMKRLGRDEALAILRPALSADLPDFLSAVAFGESALATQRLGRVLAAGASEGTVLFSLANLVGGALGGWARYRDLSATLGRRATPRGLARALDAVYRAEAAWKGGRANAGAVLEHATREVCGAA